MQVKNGVVGVHRHDRVQIVLRPRCSITDGEFLNLSIHRDPPPEESQETSATSGEGKGDSAGPAFASVTRTPQDVVHSCDAGSAGVRLPPVNLVCVVTGHRWTAAQQVTEADPVFECTRCHQRHVLPPGSVTATEAVNIVRRDFYMNADTRPFTPFLRGRKHRLWDTFKD
jgi:hypothetical protein